MLSFFIVTSSWQSGEMTLLHRNKRQLRGRMRWHCVREGVGWWRVSEYESMTKVVSAKGHADGLENMLCEVVKQTGEMNV